MPEDDKTVPLDQLIAEREKARKEAEARKATEEERDDLKAQLAEKERAGLGEVDRLKAQVSDLTAERDTARQQSQAADTARQHLERSGWVRDAAASVTFKDGEKEITGAFFDATDAVARVNLDEIRTADAAKREVAAIAQRSRHLVHVQEPEKPASQGDRLHQVLKNGEIVDSTSDDNAPPPALTEAEAAREDLRSAFAEPTTT